MPTKKKRVGFIPREDVMRIIEKLSTENNLSNSKIISILVEEALSIRGIFNKKNGKVTQSYQSNDDNSKKLFDSSGNFTDNAKLSIDTNLVLIANFALSTNLSELSDMFKESLSFDSND